MSANTEKYRPSSGAEGERFMETWCYRCSKDNYPDGPFCEIIANTMAFRINDPEYPTEWQISDGVPFCTVFEKEADND